MQNLIREYGSEFDLDSNNNYIDFGINQAFLREVELFRSGRDALRAIAIKYKGSYNRIVLPALCCESMVNPFQTNGYEISYFKLNPDLTANIEDILSKLNPNDVFLYMNYFGIQSLSEEILQLLRESFSNLIMVEDKTHDILSPRCNDFVPDFIVCSIRKWLAIPDGGVLYSKADQDNFAKIEDMFFGDIRIEAFKNKTEYMKYGNPQLKELFRSQLAVANEYLDNDHAVVGMSAKSSEILRNIDFRKIAKIRRENIRVLFQGINDMEEIKQLERSCLDKITLYYPILVSNRNGLQKTLADNGIYCPVIWPLPQQAVGVCEVSDYLSNNMLALPCDHRYGTSDIEHIVSMLKRILGE